MIAAIIRDAEGVIKVVACAITRCASAYKPKTPSKTQIPSCHPPALAALVRGAAPDTPLDLRGRDCTGAGLGGEKYLSTLTGRVLGQGVGRPPLSEGAGACDKMGADELDAGGSA